MRNFITVMNTLIRMSKDQKLTEQLEAILRDTSMTAPEARWQIRGQQVADVLYSYTISNDNATLDWYAELVAEFTCKPTEAVKQNIIDARKEAI